jgi:hypothetical protein
MHNVWGPTLDERIESFMGRKSREFPDLKLTSKWDQYEYYPKRPNFRPNKLRNA